MNTRVYMTSDVLQVLLIFTSRDSDSCIVFSVCVCVLVLQDMDLMTPTVV